MKAMVYELEPFLDEVDALSLYSQADLVSLGEKDRGWEIHGDNPEGADKIRPAVPCWSLFTKGPVAFDGHLSAC